MNHSWTVFGTSEQQPELTRITVVGPQRDRKEVAAHLKVEHPGFVIRSINVGLIDEDPDPAPTATVDDAKKAKEPKVNADATPKGKKPKAAADGQS